MVYSMEKFSPHVRRTNCRAKPSCLTIRGYFSGDFFGANSGGVSLTVQRPRRRLLPGWAFALLIIALPAALYLTVASVGLQASRTNRFKNLTMGDRAHALTAPELADALNLPVEIDPKREYVRKTREEDGSLRLIYRFPDRPSAADSLQVKCTVVRAKDAAAARQLVAALQSEVGATFEPKPDLFAWGDDGVAGQVMRGGQRAGSYVVARSDNFVWALETNAPLDSATLLDGLVRPKLEMLDTFGEPLLTAPK
jgi:hypothetical protein